MVNRKRVGAGVFIPMTFMFAVMGSTNFKIQTDSVNLGGGLGTSTNYSLESTIGEVGSGTGTSTNYMLNAGYLQMQNAYISISAEADRSMLAINGLTGGISSASTTWNVITDNPAGYTMTVHSNTAPALKNITTGGGFLDYEPEGSDPDFQFSVAATESRFGFSPEGIDITDLYKDNGTACNTGSLDTRDRCWSGFSLSEKTVAERAYANHPSGSTTTINYRAEIGTSKIQDSGTYQAEITITALML